jgi:hypothetical protein
MYMVVTDVKVMWQYCGRVCGCEPNFLSQTFIYYFQHYSYFKISYVFLTHVHLLQSTYCFIFDVYSAVTYHSNAIYPSFSTGLQRMWPSRITLGWPSHKNTVSLVPKLTAISPLFRCIPVRIYIYTLTLFCSGYNVTKFGRQVPCWINMPPPPQLVFHWHNPSGRTRALGLTQPLTEMSTRNISWGVKVAGAYCWLYHLHVPTVLKSGSL